MAARIAAEQHPNAGVILNAANQWEVFTYYHQEGAPVYPLPAGRPDATRIAEQLAELATKHDRLYAIFWGEAERDPERLVERWLDAHAFKAGDEWIGDVRFVTYALPGRLATEMQTPVDARFGEQIVMQGFSLASDQAAPGDILQLALFWQSDSLLSKRYKVFLHLVDQQGNIVSQRDSEPGGGLALTTTWEPGTTIIDNHGIPVPPDVPPGRYTLLLGLYDPGDPAIRLPVVDAYGTPSGDNLTLATIVIADE